jgi:O-antigen/teichoic acid export membrane protein
MVTRSANVRNSTWNLVNILIYPIAFLAATPFFINQLGDNTFGEWMLINSYVFIAVHLVGFGLPLSITAHVAEAIGKKDRNKLFAYINVSSNLLGKMTFFTFLLAGLMVVGVYAGIGAFNENVQMTLIVATLLIGVKFPEILFQSIFKGYEQYDKAAIYNLTTRIVTLALQFILVYLGYSLLEMYIAMLGTTFFMVLIQAFVVYSELKGYRPILFSPLPERKEIYNFGFWTWLQTIIAVAAYQADRFIVAWFLGTATVTYYVLAATIANHLHMAFEAVVSWFLPKISRIKAAHGDTLRYFYTIRAFSVGFSLLSISMVFALSEPLFHLWLGSEKSTNIIGFFRLFLIFEAFLILSIVPKLYLNATKSLSFITGLELMYKSAIVVGLVAFFWIWHTAVSLIWGQIVALIIFMPLEYYLVNRYVLKQNQIKETFFTMLSSLLVMGAILSSRWEFSLFFFIFAVISFWLVYLKTSLFSIKILTE